jgi:hypothetical protein
MRELIRELFYDVIRCSVFHLTRDEAEDFCVWLSVAFDGWIQWWMAKTSALEG